MRIAIVGAGISGLVASYLLAREHEITVFEASDYPGGHTYTVTVDLGAGPCPVDTGFIVYNHRTYPYFTRLLAQLGVATQPSAMSFSVTCERTGLEYGSNFRHGIFAQRRNLVRPKFLGMLADIIRFYRNAPRLLDRPGDEMTVREYLRHAGMSQGFVEHYLVPLGASMWSCPPQQFYEFPVRFMVRFMDNHGMLSLSDLPTWRVIRGGSARYVEALTASFRDRLRLNTPVASIRRHADRVEITPQGGPPEHYDHVVIACHSDQALALLADPSPTERDLLGAIPYQTNDVVLHTDTSVLPSRRQAWSSWNYRIPREDRDRAVLTYNMNSLQSLRTPEVACVTVNDDTGIDPNKILRRIRYHHPVFTVAAPRVQAMHSQLINNNRSSYCGAYWGYGFHEDGVKSALAVCHNFGITL